MKKKIDTDATPETTNPAAEEPQTPEAATYQNLPYDLYTHLPNYVPRTEPERIAWLENFARAGDAYLATFPSILNATGPVSIYRLKAALERLREALVAIKAVANHGKALTAWKNNILLNRTNGPVPAPIPEKGMTPTTEAASTGALGMAVEMAEALLKDPKFTKMHEEAFDLAPKHAPAPDPETLDPHVKAKFSGGQVVLAYRSPRNTPGADMVEIYANHGDGRLVRLATTTHAKFTDHHELPSDGTRTVWNYRVGFIDRTGATVGQQSLVEVTVYGKASTIGS